jgi:hypothetical protein
MLHSCRGRTDIFAYSFFATRDFCWHTRTISTIPHQSLSLCMRARAYARTHTHTPTQIYSLSFLPFAHWIGLLETIRIVTGSLILLTLQLVAKVYSFIIDLRKGKRIEEKQECKHAFASRTQRKTFTAWSYFSIQFGQDKRYFLIGMRTEQDCGLFSFHRVSFADGNGKLLSWPASNRMRPSKTKCLLHNNYLFTFRIPFILFNVSLLEHFVTLIC